MNNFIAVFWRTWVVLLAPFLLSPLLFLARHSELAESLKCGYTILLMAVRRFPLSSRKTDNFIIE